MRSRIMAVRGSGKALCGPRRGDKDVAARVLRGHAMQTRSPIPVPTSFSALCPRGFRVTLTA